MKTRKQYMNKEISHQDYYLQFADDSTRSWIKSVIGIDRLNKSTDEHLNDIPLSLWDSYHTAWLFSEPSKLCSKANGYTGNGISVSQSDAVCTAKACARQMIQEQIAA